MIKGAIAVLLIGLATAVATGDVGNLSRTAAVSRQFELEQAFGRVDEAIAARRWPDVAIHLQSILDQHQEGVVFRGGSYRGVTAAALELIAGLPFEGQQAYRRRVDDPARQQLRSALERGDLDQLLRIGRQYRGTPPGTAALRTLLFAHLDRGELTRARMVLQELQRQTGHRLGSGMLERLALLLDVNDPPEPRRSGEQEAVGDSAWEVRYPLDPVTFGVVDEGVRDLRENGLTPYLPVTCVSVGKDVLTITPDAVVSVDAHTGAVRWRRESELIQARLFRNAGEGTDLNRQRLLSIALLRRLFGQSSYLQLTTDGQRLFLIEPGDLDPGMVPIPVPSEEDAEFPANRLVCLRADTGELEWETRGGPVAPCLFLGPPTPYAGQLFVLAESATTREIALLELNPETGEIERSIGLALPLLSLSEDRRRLTTACPVTVSGGWLICPTGAGTLVAVDPLTGEFQWGQRFPRVDAIDTAARQLEPDPRITGFHWWTGWQAMQVFGIGERVIYVTPEVEQLHVLDRRTGRVLHAISRDDGLSVAAVNEETGIVIIGRWQARCFDLETGQQRWSVPIPPPAGHGVQFGSHYRFPIHASGQAELNLANGDVRVFPGSPPENISPANDKALVLGEWIPRNLSQADGALYELSARGCRRIPTATTKSADFATLSASEADLNRNDGPAAIQEQLKTHFLHRDWREFVSLWFSREFVDASQVMVTIEAGRGRCRLSRWMQGFVNEHWESLEAAEQRQFSIAIDAAVEGAEIEPNQLFELAGQTAWGRHWRSTSVRRPDRLSEFIHLQMDLLELSSDSDSEIATFAAARLAALNAEHGPLQSTSENVPQDSEASPPVTPWPVTKPDVRRKQRRSTDIYFSTIPVAAMSGSVFNQLHVELDWPSARGLRLSGRHWPEEWFAYLPTSNRPLRIEPDLNRAWGLGQLLILQTGSELTALSSFLLGGQPDAEVLWPTRGNRIDTLGDRSNLMLSFLREHPRQRPGFPDLPVRRLNEFGREATAVGPVRPGYFCLQQKGMLVAHETATGHELWRRFDIPQRVRCFGDDRHVLVVDSGTGHARLLSSLDGRLLNEFHLEFDLDDVVAEQGVELLFVHGDPHATAFDAAENSTNENAPAADEVPLPEQPTAIPEGLHLRRFNLVTQQTQWERTWPTGAIPFALDDRWLGIAHRAQASQAVDAEETDHGKVTRAFSSVNETAIWSIELLDMRTGRTVVTHEWRLPAEIQRIVCSPGMDDLLVVFSGDVDDTPLTNAPQRHQGYRRPFVNGPACAFRRDSGELLWRSELGNTVFPLDQPKDLPVFVTAEGRYPEHPMDSGTHGSRIRAFNRQTGELLYESESVSPMETNYNLSGDVSTGIVTLTTQNVLVEFDFSGSTIKPAR